MANELTLSVNGAKQTITVDPDTSLLFVLRNELKLTGPKLGCGMAQCGACAVLLDGEEIGCVHEHAILLLAPSTFVEGCSPTLTGKIGIDRGGATKL